MSDANGWSFDLLCEQKPEVKEALEALGRFAPTFNPANKGKYALCIDAAESATTANGAERSHGGCANG